MRIKSLVSCIALCAAIPAIAQAPARQKAASEPPAANRPKVDRPTVDRDVLHVQVILDMLGFGPGVLNGQRSSVFANALKGFQESRGLKTTGEADAATLRALHAYRAKRPTVSVPIDTRSIAGPFVAQMPKDYAEQAKLDSMAYASPLEKLAERFHTTPAVLVALNGEGKRIAPGETITVPNTLPSSRSYPADASPEWRATLSGLNVEAKVPHAARITVSKSAKVLRAYDAQGRLIAQYSATIGSASDPLPIGDWRVTNVSTNPDWRMTPELLKGVSNSKPSQIIPPGPNNPVGVVWIGLSRRHYGIHGTPNPEKIGQMESNGCVRLTNWDAARVALMVDDHTPVIFRS